MKVRPCDRVSLGFPLMPQNRSFYELDVLFTNRVPARRFKSYKVSVETDGIEKASEERVEVAT
jgi:hypothetical protein